MDDRRGKNKVGTNKKNVQWVYPERCVEITHLHVSTNYPPTSGDGRIRDWKPQLELTPEPDIYWAQIVKIDGVWTSAPTPRPPVEAPTASLTPSIRTNHWPLQDNLAKFACNRCNFPLSVFGDKNDRRMLLCCNPVICDKA